MLNKTYFSGTCALPTPENAMLFRIVPPDMPLHMPLPTGTIVVFTCNEGYRTSTSTHS